MRISDWSSDVCSSDLLISLIQRTHPNRSVEPHASLGQVLETQLEDGELDFAIIAGPSTRTAIASHSIGQVQFVWVAAPGLYRGDHPLRAQDVAGQTLVTLPNSAGTVRILDEWLRSEEHTSELQSLMRTSYAVFCLKKKKL